ncbi:winged helix-turn-helix domain-containing protein [Variovorax sp. Sphag1AA]|uniref:winged helix-turn-helix domain-containing protein n=1 Tax=Variovorax sp. Sphag1AA TaxID=2587027 RepID=UPI001615DB2E|nr:winged helix-turn-helix domain-containing protein [Variovorax sp. Sphag1AA]MBB3180994.1 DNA-binding transcriptional ArsR family regulator [Variovorax sp. Sphag1AA]
MKNSRQLSQTYLKFVNLVSAIRGLPALDAVEERVLTGLAVAWSKGERVPVLQAMELAPDSSPTTVHRRLKSLREKGLIELREDERDSRIKYVLPTSAAEDYFARLGKCLSTAARG